jgi:hypothetical protein
MTEKLGLTRLEQRPKPFCPTGQYRQKFYIFKDEDFGYWYVLIPSILRTFVRQSEADWYVFDRFDEARRWVSRALRKVA